MARIVIVAGTDAGQDVAAALSAAGHQVVRTDSLSSQSASQGEVIFVEPWLYAADNTPADAPVVMLTSNEALPAAVQAVSNGGAYDLLRVPCTSDEVRIVADRALRYQQLAAENRHLREQFGQQSAMSSNGEPAAEGVDKSNPDAVALAAKNLAGKPLADIEKQVILRTLEQFKGHR